MFKSRALTIILVLLTLVQSCALKEQPITLVLESQYNGQKLGDKAKPFVIKESDSLLIDLTKISDKTSLLLLETPNSFYWVKYDEGTRLLTLSSRTLNHDSVTKQFSNFQDGQYFIVIGNQDQAFSSPRHIASSFICELIVEKTTQHN